MLELIMAKTNSFKRDIAKLRSEVRKWDKELAKTKVEFLSTKKDINPFTGLVSGNYWTQTGMPWVSSEGRKAVLTEWFWQPIRGQPRRVDTNELRQFCQTFWVHACIRTIIEEITSLEWDIIPKDDYKYDEVREEIVEIKSFLKFPNKNGDSLPTIVRALVKDILELDAGVVVKVFDIDSYDFNQLEPKSGAPLLKPLGQRKMVELYARDGSSFLIEADKFGFERGYWQYSYQIPAHPMWFNRDEIVYVRQHPRSMSVYGYAVPQAILDIVKSLHYSTLYNKRFFEETPIPDGALSLLDTNETEMKAFINYWNNEFKAQPHKLAVINKDVKWQPFNITNRELEFLETQKWYFRMVVSAFGLTPSELGLTDDLNKSTASTQAEVSKRKAIRPLLVLLESAINNNILTEFQAEGVQFTFVYDDPAEKNQRLGNWEKELNLGLKTINEVRVEEGLEPVPWGDMPSNMRPVMGGGFGGQPAGLGGEAGPNVSEKPIAETGEEEQVEAHTSGYDEERRRAEAKTDQDKETLNPYSGAKRPVGSFRSATAQMKKSNVSKSENTLEEDAKIYAQMIGFEGDIRIFTEGFKIEMEHIDAVGGNKETVANIVVDHLKEDVNYYSKLRQVEMPVVGAVPRKDGKQELYGIGAETTRDAGMSKRMDVGQYYHTPDEVIRPSRGIISQPQNNPDLVAPQLGSDFRRPSKDTYVSPNQYMDDASKIKCPYCGYDTLSQFNSADDIGSEVKFRCANCSALLSQMELIDANVLANLTNTTTQTSTNQVSVPRWSPKSFTSSNPDDLVKSGIDVAKWVGFATSALLTDIEDYIKNFYDGQRDEGITDISIRQANRIKQKLLSAFRRGWSISKLTDEIDTIVKDEPKASAIARTETVYIANEAYVKSATKRGIKEFRWLAADDDRMCDKCGLNHMKIFKSADLPKCPAHTNCRCRKVEHI